MDEPFGALDALTREQMRIDLEKLWLDAAADHALRHPRHRRGRGTRRPGGGDDAAARPDRPDRRGRPAAAARQGGGDEPRASPSSATRSPNASCATASSGTEPLRDTMLPRPLHRRGRRAVPADARRRRDRLGDARALHGLDRGAVARRDRHEHGRLGGDCPHRRGADRGRARLPAGDRRARAPPLGPGRRLDHGPRRGRRSGSPAKGWRASPSSRLCRPSRASPCRPRCSYRYHRAIADAGGLPIVCFQFPKGWGPDYTPEILRRMAEIPELVAIKEASFDVAQTLCRRSRPRPGSSGRSACSRAATLSSSRP